MAAGVLTESAVTTASEWPRVTWLMPVLNGMPYLRELLDSLVAQTYPNHEIIVWDNGGAIFPTQRRRSTTIT